MRIMETNRLTITSSVYAGVTELPHFPVVIDYEGCHLEIEDIYFDNIEILSEQLERLEKTRKGEIIFDGGSRFGLQAIANVHGGITICFRAAPVNFPGKLILEGCFQIDGEHAAQTVRELRRLFSKGEPLAIEQPRKPKA